MDSFLDTIIKLPKLTQEEIKNLNNTRSIMEISYVIETKITSLTTIQVQMASG